MDSKIYIIVAVLFGISATVSAQSQCPNTTYCGTRCCDTNTVNSACCTEGIDCCRPNDDNQVTLCGPNLLACPAALPPDEVYDDSVPPQLKNQCCSYFQSGCCSQAENDTLLLLFRLAIGLSIGLFALLLIIIVLIAICCCCFWCL